MSVGQLLAMKPEQRAKAIAAIPESMRVNPEHLEPITRSENTRRSINIFMQNARKTHCSHGHEFTKDNTYRTPRGYRGCVACRDESEACPRCGKTITRQNLRRHKRIVHRLETENTK